MCIFTNEMCLIVHILAYFATSVLRVFYYFVYECSNFSQLGAWPALGQWSHGLLAFYMLEFTILVYIIRQ